MHFSINDWHNYFFDIMIWTSFVLLALSMVYTDSNMGIYFKQLDYLIRLYISIALLIRFNPFVKNDYITKLDKKVAYNAGLLLITGTIVNQYILLVKNGIVNELNQLSETVKQMRK